SQGRTSSPRNPSKALKARSMASCTTSSASAEEPASQRARLYAASMCGSASASNLWRSAVIEHLDPGVGDPIPAAVDLFATPPPRPSLVVSRAQERGKLKLRP